MFSPERAERWSAVSGSSPEIESPCFARVIVVCVRAATKRCRRAASAPLNFMKSCRWTRFRLKVSRDQARAFIKAQVSPGPLEHYYYTIPKSDQKQDMDKQPCHPGRQSAQMQKVQVRDSFIPSDCSHTALIEVPKALRISPCNHT